MAYKRPKAKKQEIVVVEAQPEVLPEIVDEPGQVYDTTSFLKESLFEDAPVPETALAPVTPVSIADYADDERKEFVKLLREKQSAEERAERLIELTGYTDERRAGVALRAIQEINSLMGISVDKPTETAPLFVLPADTSVSVTVETPKK